MATKYVFHHWQATVVLILNGKAVLPHLCLINHHSKVNSLFGVFQSGAGPSPRGKRGPSHTPKQHRDRGIDFYFSKGKQQ